MSGSYVEQVLGQTRKSVALSGQQITEIAKMSRAELCALSVVLSRWRVATASNPKGFAGFCTRISRRFLSFVGMGSELSQSSQAKSVTPGAVYKQLSKGDQILPEQFAAMRNWSVPNLLALVVMLQADLVGSSKIERVVGQPFTNLPRTQWSIESGTRRRRRSRRIVRERWLGLLVAVVLLIAMPLLGATEAGRAVVQVSVPFLIGAASLWLFSQGRWLAESRNDTKVQAGRAAVTMSAIGSLIAVVWILTEIAGIGLSIGVDIVRYATAL